MHFHKNRPGSQRILGVILANSKKRGIHSIVLRNIRLEFVISLHKFVFSYFLAQESSLVKFGLV
jgi:hypothetical protein